MKKFFALVLALVMALSLMTVAWGADVANETDLATAVAAGGEIKLTSSFDLTSGIVVTKDITLDLNGYTISATCNSSGFAMFHVKNGVTMTVKDSSAAQNGKLTIAAGTANVGYVIFVEGALVLESGTLETTGSWSISFAVDAHPNAWGTTYTEPTTFTMNGGKIVTSDAGVRVANYSAPNAAVSATFTMNGGEIDSANDGIFVQHVVACDLAVDVSDGTITSDTHALRIYGTQVNDVDVSISGGNFTGKFTNLDVTGNGDTTVSGGTFDTDVSAYVVDGKQLLANGTVVDTPAASAVAPTLYVWDTAAKDWATYYIATGDDLDDLKLGADENCLPCYLIDGRYFVDTTEAAATYKLVYGATKLFLAPVDVTDVRYLDKATVYTNVTKETDECGKLVITDTTKTYYVAYDENNYDEDYYFVATKNGPVQLLVGGKIVDVAPNGAQDLTAHVWKGYDVVNNAYTTAKCENCGKVVKLYATGTAAGKGAHYEAGLGYITKIDNGFGPAVVTPSTDKTVTSAETFDAGIAMYVGMSVMAAAGSAVVLKKKD